jgi:hypothetical protein
MISLLSSIMTYLPAIMILLGVGVFGWQKWDISNLEKKNVELEDKLSSLDIYTVQLEDSLSYMREQAEVFIAERKVLKERVENTEIIMKEIEVENRKQITKIRSGKIKDTCDATFEWLVDTTKELSKKWKN